MSPVGAPSTAGRSTRPAAASGLGDASILIVNWNAGPLLRECAHAALATGAEVVLVDNASTDGSADEVVARVPGLRVLREPVNLGFAGAVNLAARAAHGRWLLLLNPDALPTAEAVERLRACLLSHERAGAVGACLVDAAGRPQVGFTLRRLPSLAALVCDLLLIDDLWPDNPARRRYLAADVPLDGDTPFEAEQPAAACLMVRREAFDAVGGFDPAFHPAWFEDVDFCRRLREAGWVILFDPGARVTHVGGSSVAALGRTGFAVAFHRNMRRYVAKHHGQAASVLIWLLQAVGMTMRAVIALATADGERWRAAAAVLRDLLSRATPAAPAPPLSRP